MNNIPDDMAEIFDDFLVETNESLSALDQHFIDLESNPNDTGLLNEIFRTVHSIKGGAGFLGLSELVDVAHGSENILNRLRNGDLAVSADIIDVVLESVDMIKAMLAQLQGEDVGALDVDGMVQKLGLMLQFAEEVETTAGLKTAPPARGTDAPEADPPGEPERGTAPPAVPTEAAPGEEPVVETPSEATPHAPRTRPEPDEPKSVAPAAMPKVEMETSIRVDTGRLDNVMNLVGELVLCRNRTLKLVSELDARYENDLALRELVNTAGQLNLVTTDLQLSVMKTRMQPVGKIFQKFPRMVRDMSRKLDKQIQLEIRGEDTELDKSMLEELGDPLVHLVRNAIDHGIETVNERLRIGKPEAGTLRLSAAYDGASIVIRISDDGAGIHPERVKGKVLEKGLMSAEQLDALPEKEVYNLIFLPGLSTKDEVSDLSGRGVGMDVVLNNIRKVGGIIDLDATIGKGTTVTLTLPLTIAIVQTMMVSTGGRLFAIPLSSIVETLRLEPREIQAVDGRNMIRLRERIIPIVRLADLFDLSAEEHRPGERLNVIVVALAEKKVGILVEDLHQQEEVVIKSLGDYLGDIPGISGATINGEGHVVLILDVGVLIDSLS